jgi:hypothetical protein
MNKKNNLKKLLKANKLGKWKSEGDRAEDILNLIRARDRRARDVYKDPIWEKPIGIWRHGQPKPVTNRPMTADTWQRFKRDFITKYNGEEVKETGFTDSEFLDFFLRGERELHKKPGRMETLLAELHAHDDAGKGDKDEE